jgi:septum formation inhibitor MinC
VEDPKRIAELEAEIEKLKAKIKKKDCIADLRRKQNREKNRQLVEAKRGIMKAYKAIYGEK